MSKIAVNEITDEVGTGAPTLSNGVAVTGDIDVSGKLTNGGTSGIEIDSSGRVAISNQPAFLAFSDGFAHPGGVTAIGGVWTVSYNIGSYYNSSTRRFTAPIAGRYQFNGTVATGSNTGAFDFLSCEFWVNGGRFFIGGWDSGGQSYGQTSSSVVLSLNAGDYVELACESSKSFSLIGTKETSFSGFLVG